MVLVEKGEVFDITAVQPLVAEILNSEDLTTLLKALRTREHIGSALELLENSIVPHAEANAPFCFAPADLQSLKACGVTFVDSLLERIIEEHCDGNAARAGEARREIESQIGNELRSVHPGTMEAEALKRVLQARGLWSQYLEVGLGRYVEVFTKAQPLSAVCFGAEIGLHCDSVGNYPVPEVVLAVNAAGKIVGCSLGNDANLRDFEGCSALLLGVAKDNNASCAI